MKKWVVSYIIALAVQLSLTAQTGLSVPQWGNILALTGWRCLFAASALSFSAP